MQQVTCANTSALRHHERSEVLADLAHERAEGDAFRELTTDVGAFLEAIEDMGCELDDGNLTEEKIRASEAQRFYSAPGAVETRIERAKRARAAIKALQGIVVNHAYNRAQTDHERAIAAFLQDVTRYWVDTKIEALQAA